MDSHENPLNPTEKEARGLMARADSRLAEPAGLSKGMTIVLAVGPMLLTLILAIIGYIALFTGESASTRSDVKALNEKLDLYLKIQENNISEIKSDIRRMNDGYQQLEVIKARLDSFEAGFKAAREK